MTMITSSPGCERHTRYAAKDELIEDCADCRALAESHAEADATPTKRDEFAARFGEDNAALVESCAETHKAIRAFDEERGYGSDAFRWAVLMVISFECLSRDSFRDSHGFTCEWPTVKAWLMEPAQRVWLSQHDGDVDYLAMLSGTYNEFMPEPELVAPSPVSGARTTGVGDGE